jgi:hypothetical protein
MNGNIFSWYGMSHPGMEIILPGTEYPIHEWKYFASSFFLF